MSCVCVCGEVGCVGKGRGGVRVAGITFVGCVLIAAAEWRLNQHTAVIAKVLNKAETIIFIARKLLDENKRGQQSIYI